MCNVCREAGQHNMFVAYAQEPERSSRMKVIQWRLGRIMPERAQDPATGDRRGGSLDFPPCLLNGVFRLNVRTGTSFRFLEWKHETPGENMSTNKTIETWPVEKLVPYIRNPRKNDAAVTRMRASLTEFGFKIPMLVRGDGEIVDGHLRLKAALKLG